MKGKEDVPIDSTDIEYDVVQESFFYYLFGVQEVGFNAVLHLDTGKAVLFAPKQDLIYKIWLIMLDKEQIAAKYEADALYNEDLLGYLQKHSPKTIYLNSGINSDSGLETVVPTFKWL